MKGQPHLVVSPDPLEQRQDYKALCGKEVSEAVWVWQVVERGEVVDRIKTCAKCWAQLSPERVTEYVYGAIPASEAQEEMQEAV